VENQKLIDIVDLLSFLGNENVRRATSEYIYGYLNVYNRYQVYTRKIVNIV